MSIYADYWAAAEARDWDRLATFVSADVEGTWPQTRERSVGREALLRFMAAYPGDWHLVLEVEHRDDAGAATRIAFTNDGETMAGLTFFTLDDDGLIATFTEYWPEPYDPPTTRSHLLSRY
jgi:hypothetical protein